MTATLRPIKVTNEMAKFELADQATTHRDVRPSERRGKEASNPNGLERRPKPPTGSSISRLRTPAQV